MGRLLFWVKGCRLMLSCWTAFRLALRRNFLSVCCPTRVQPDEDAPLSFAQRMLLTPLTLTQLQLRGNGFSLTGNGFSRARWRGRSTRAFG
eukprot:6199746-Pleurochrysis_carterae.AAC.4